MKAARVLIQNVLGIESIEFELGAEITEVLGDNGAGKTSALDAICAALGGETKRMLRSGADKGRVWIQLDDEAGTEIERSWTRDGGTDLEVRQNGRKMGRAAEFVRQLANLRSVRPAVFLTCTDRERIDILLRAVPISLPSEFPDWARRELGHAIKPEVFKQHAVLAVDAVLDEAEQQRLRAGQEKRAKEASRNELEATLRGVKRLTADQAEAEVKGLTRAHDDARKKLAAAERETDGLLAEHKAHLNERFAEDEKRIRDEARRQVEEARRLRDEAVAEAELLAYENKREALADYTSATADIAPRLSAARAAVSEAARIDSQFRLLDRYAAEEAEAEQGWRRLNEVVDKIRSDKARMIQRLPIPGVEIAGGELLRHGVPFDRLNAAQQVEIVLDIAELVSGKLPLVVADEMNRLTPHNRKALIEAAAERGLQFVFATAVEGMPLTVRHYSAGQGEYQPPDQQLVLLPGGAR